MALIVGTDGNDTISPGFSSPGVTGGLVGNGGDTIQGGAGNDSLTGGSGNDQILAGDGQDQVFGNDGDDLLEGGAGNDFLRGGDGADTINGGDGDDRLAAERGADRLDGGLGNDTLGATDGTLFVDGGAGDDVLLTSGDVTATIFQNIETWSLDGGGRLTAAQINAFPHAVFAPGDSLVLTLVGGGTIGGNFEFTGTSTFNIRGSDAVDVFLFGAAVGAVTIADAGGGGDTIVTGSGNDSVTAGAGDDTLVGGEGNDSLDGGADNDLFYGGAGNDRMSGGTGDDIYQVDSIGDVIVEAAGQGNDTAFVLVAGWTVGAGVETVYLYNAANQVTGSAGNDQIVANAAAGSLLSGDQGDDILWGQSGTDTLDGGAGRDVLRGGGGDDVLIGGAGLDQLVGGAGADRFTFNAPGWAEDEIFDFSRAEGDRIDLRGSGILSLAGFAAIQEISGNSQFIAADGSIIDVYGVTGLTAADFIFA